jgi:hypothetical protein
MEGRVMPKGVYKRQTGLPGKRLYSELIKRAKIRTYGSYLAQIAVRFTPDEYNDILVYSKNNNLSLSNAVSNLAMKALA